MLCAPGVKIYGLSGRVKRRKVRYLFTIPRSTGSAPRSTVHDTTNHVSSSSTISDAVDQVWISQHVAIFRCRALKANCELNEIKFDRELTTWWLFGMSSLRDSWGVSTGEQGIKALITYYLLIFGKKFESEHRRQPCRSSSWATATYVC